jgi:hypothetical protein
MRRSADRRYETESNLQAASSFGPLVFSNPPDATTNNFWRIRSVP